MDIKYRIHKNKSCVVTKTQVSIKVNIIALCTTKESCNSILVVTRYVFSEAFSQCATLYPSTMEYRTNRISSQSISLNGIILIVFFARMFLCLYFPYNIPEHVSRIVRYHFLLGWKKRTKIRKQYYLYLLHLDA